MQGKYWPDRADTLVDLNLACDPIWKAHAARLRVPVRKPLLVPSFAGLQLLWGQPNNGCFVAGKRRQCAPSSRRIAWGTELQCHFAVVPQIAVDYSFVCLGVWVSGLCLCTNQSSFEGLGRSTLGKCSRREPQERKMFRGVSVFSVYNRVV